MIKNRFFPRDGRTQKQNSILKMITNSQDFEGLEKIESGRVVAPVPALARLLGVRRVPAAITVEDMQALSFSSTGFWNICSLHFYSRKSIVGTRLRRRRTSAARPTGGRSNSSECLTFLSLDLNWNSSSRRSQRILVYLTTVCMLPTFLAVEHQQHVIKLKFGKYCVNVLREVYEIRAEYLRARPCVDKT